MPTLHLRHTTINTNTIFLGAVYEYIHIYVLQYSLNNSFRQRPDRLTHVVGHLRKMVS